MKTNWAVESVSHQFDAYDDYLEDLFGYQPLITDLIATIGQNVHVLDYGCGGGKVSRRMRHYDIQQVTGVDISQTMIAKASSHGDPDNLHYYEIESGIIPLADSLCDGAICCFVFINVPDKAELQHIANEVFRVVKPGAPFYILDTNPDSTGIKYSSFKNGEADQRYQDGMERPVYLDLPNGEVFKIIDTHWSKETYRDVLTNANFSNIEMVEMSRDALPEEHRMRLDPMESDRPPFVMFKCTRPA